MSRRIFLSGVHGVGKGYFVNTSIRGKYDVTVISASDVISKCRQSDDGTKRVDNIYSNQDILLHSIKIMLKEQSKTLILDGHLVLLSKQDEVERIPFSFFDDGMFDTVFLLQDEPKNVINRLFQRDGFYKLDIDTISKMQEEELRYAQELEKRGVSVVYLNPFSDCNLYDSYLR